MLNVKSHLKLLVTLALKNIQSQGEFIDQLVTKNLIFIKFQKIPALILIFLLP